MRKSIWRFKRSRFFERDQSPFFLHSRASLILAGVSIIAAASCRLHQSAADSKAGGGGGFNPFSALSDKLTEPPEDVYVPILVADDPFPLAQTRPLVCNAPTKAPSQLKLRMTMESLFGIHPVDITIEQFAMERRARVEVEGRTLSFPLSSKEFRALRDASCVEPEGGVDNSGSRADDQISEVIRTMAQRIGPDCEITRNQQRWRCNLPAIDPQLALEELTGIRSTMIRRWSRQPYLFSRRLAVASGLARVLLSPDPDPEFDTFCKIITNSLPTELPAMLTSKRWQKATCEGTGLDRLDMANFGLTKALAEIDFLKQLFERTSRLGYLSIRIPRDQVPHKRLWVILQPEDEVTDNLTQETTKLWSESKESTEGDPLPRSCWHPAIGSDGKLTRLARLLGLTGEAQEVSCQADEDSTTTPDRYLAESITSETEFVITNGRSKLLRLPIGSYTYTLQTLPADPHEWDDAAANGPKSKGRIVWEKRRPRPTIKTW